MGKELRMASGKKNYFRHSASAFEDPKIQKAISLLGYEGYAFYFILLELFTKQCENEFKNPITIHQQTVRIVLRKSQQSCHKVVTKLQESGLFVVTFKESFYEFHIPNLAKYLGKYEAKIHPNAPNKRKEKERKEKEIKDINKDLVNTESVASQKQSPLSFLFSKDPEIQSWLDDGIYETHLMLLKKFSHHVLADLIEKAYAWAKPRGAKAETWLYTFVSNKNTSGFGLNRAKVTKSRITPGNPTGNPYLDDFGRVLEEA
jgi:hypothetical protein